MRAQLPEYIVNCLVASGFDSSIALGTLDLSEKPTNSLEDVRRFITKKFPNDDRYKCDASSCVAEFPPGHINLIKEFVKDINRIPYKRRCTSSNPPSKKRAITSAVSGDNEEQPIIELDKISASIRQQIASWQRNQKDDRLRSMKEHVDFQVHVKLNKEGTNCSASVECKKCNTLHSLGMSVKKKPKISNWSRHATKCSTKTTKHSSSTMHSYFRQEVTPTTNVPIFMPRWAEPRGIQ